jgi:RNA polymerase sigma-70 factor (ECF subfamily)
MSCIKRVFEENRDRLFAYLLRMTGSRDMAHDILQESITRCFEHYRNRDIAPALLFTVARNAYIDHVRKTSRNIDLDDSHADEGPDLEHQAIAKERFRRVLRGIRELSEEDRDILSMVAGGDLSYGEISSVLDISVANVKVRVHRARLRLRHYMEGEGNE